MGLRIACGYRYKDGRVCKGEITELWENPVTGNLMGLCSQGGYDGSHGFAHFRRTWAGGAGAYLGGELGVRLPIAMDKDFEESFAKIPMPIGRGHFIPRYVKKDQETD